jgi:hypothetical protein
MEEGHKHRLLHLELKMRAQLWRALEGVEQLFLRCREDPLQAQLEEEKGVKVERARAMHLSKYILTRTGSRASAMR